MCTVTFIPFKEKIYITSNRDEKHWRTDAVMPAVYNYQTGKILFPKDGDAGGTWIAVHANGNAIVFLNGGFIPHTPQAPYRKSRGLILLDLIEGATPFNSFIAINLNNIEPFTAIIWDQNHLFECRWDGEQKYSRQLNEKLSHIWSSVTLYDEEVIQKRSNWFTGWLHHHPHPSQQDILHFHQFTGDGDAHNDLRMDRDGKVFTVSVTSLVLTNQLATMHYLDLKNQHHTQQALAIKKSTVSQ